jgi:hypothetical protein
MFNNVALDIFIGLIFIYLLYSLLATIVMEFIAHYMALRARMLVKTLRRMLEDNPREIFGIKKRWTVLDSISDFKESVKRFFYPFRNLPFLYRFYQHPTIKYLGESKSSSKPSYLQAGNFSQTMIQILRGKDFRAGTDQMAAIEKYLFVEAPAITAQYNRFKHWILNLKKLKEILDSKNTTSEIAAELRKYASNQIRYKPRRDLILKLADEIGQFKSKEDIENFMHDLRPVIHHLPQKISHDTLTHFQNLFNDAQYNFHSFRDKLENWYNETMDRATGWYKKQTQMILLTLGFILAIVANIDTIRIYKILSRDKTARAQMVNLAMQSKDKYAIVIDSIDSRNKDTTSRIRSTNDTIPNTYRITTGDSLYDQTYKVLQQDLDNASSILGLGWCSSDSCKKYQRLFDSLKIVKDTVAKENLAAVKKEMAKVKMIRNGFRDPWDGWSLTGWLITALAISLGAPFWFDLLNKITRMRATGVRETPANEPDKRGTQPASVSINSVSNSNSGGEAVG